MMTSSANAPNAQDAVQEINTPRASASPQVTRTFTILAERLSSFGFALEGLNRRAKRLGVPALTCVAGKAYHEGKDLNTDAPETRFLVDVTVTGESPRLAGWTLIAVLQHLDGENLISNLTDAPVNTTYRTRGAFCDHCKTSRKRTDTFVLVQDKKESSADGATCGGADFKDISSKQIQVGRSCLKDFTGDDRVSAAANRASILAALNDLAEEGMEGGSMGVSRVLPLDSYLKIVVTTIRISGWVSRTKARDLGCRATADIALMGSAKDSSTDDSAKAAAALSWAESLTDEQIDAASGDYLHNVRAVARAGMVSLKTAGIAASIPSAYDRAQADALTKENAKASVYFGTIGKRETFTLTLTKVFSFDSMYGTSFVYIFIDASGNIAVWKASSSQDVTTGKTYSVKGTVKEHSEYKGVKQTNLSRCKIAFLEVK
jgi:hypothetical protein